MALEEYLVPYWSRTNICFDGQRACGGCSWSACDPVTEKPLFRPVPGWTAEPSMLYPAGGGEKNERGLDLPRYRLPAVCA